MHADLERGLSHRMKWIAQAGHAAIATQKIKVGAELTPLALAVAGEEGEEPRVLGLYIYLDHCTLGIRGTQLTQVYVCMYIWKGDGWRLRYI